MLAIIDIVLTTSILLKALCIFWFNSREISFSACPTQMYFIHGFFMIESGTFVAVAFDHYVAICDPLRNSIILTNHVVAMIGLAVLLRGCIIVLPSILLANQWPYFRTSVIPNTHCEHLAVVKLACADIQISTSYGLFVVLGVIGLDVIFITLSYTHILRVILSLPTKHAHITTFGTCGSHLCAILAFYFPRLVSFLAHQFVQNVPLHSQILMSNVYLVVSPMPNPMIYGVSIKQIRARLPWLFPLNGN
ncbi:olfactory receptor 52E2-like [Carettochelys insculpta]|uniref:olfactory receptor 52E2-like n=1 Tax=Carettochelys insculpta TaxID=44489 RepID=UPI003EB8F1EC